MRQRLAISATISVAVALAGPAVVLAAKRTTGSTVYRAFHRNGSGALGHVRVRRGYCWSGSESTVRRDAWRCMSGNEIYDPCFSFNVAAGSVLCPQGPWSRVGVKIQLTRPLPVRYGGHSEPSSGLRPWALTLYDGRRCLLATGATNVIGGKRLNYFCTTHRHFGLWGLPDRRSQPWTILMAPFNAKRLRRRVAIRHAWM